jgi:hypothetical protein
MFVFSSKLTKLGQFDHEMLVKGQKRRYIRIPWVLLCLQIIHFIAFKPTVKKILSIKISILHTSAVLKLLQHKYTLQEDVIPK